MPNTTQNPFKEKIKSLLKKVELLLEHKKSLLKEKEELELKTNSISFEKKEYLNDNSLITAIDNVVFLLETSKKLQRNKEMTIEVTVKILEQLNSILKAIHTELPITQLDECKFIKETHASVTKELNLISEELKK